LTFRTSYRYYPRALKAYLVGLAVFAVGTWPLLWSRAGADPGVGPVLTLSTFVVLPAVPALLVLVLTGVLWLHQYTLDSAAIEVKQGAIRRQMRIDEITVIAIVHHRSETFPCVVNRDGRGMFLGRGLPGKDLRTLLEWGRRTSATSNVPLRTDVSVQGFRKIAMHGLAYGLPR